MLDDDEVTIPLIKPVTLGSGDSAVTYRELTLREPTGGELEQAAREHTGVGSMIVLISLVAVVPRKAVEKMGQRDLRACSRFLERFGDDGTESATPGDASSLN